MSRLSLQVSYDNKINELRKLIEVEAQKLQKTIEAKDSALLELNKLREHKTTLNRVLVDLEKQIKEKQENLNQIIEKESNFLSSIKKETEKERKTLTETQINLEKVNEELDLLTKLSLELEKFVKKEGDVRIQYLDIKEKLENSIKQYENIVKTSKTEKESINREGKELDAYKEYVIDVYGKLASYVKVANETIKYVNDYLEENGTPIQFELPPGEIIKIDFNNFNKKPK